MKIPLFVLFLFSFIFSCSFVYSQDEKSNKLPVVNLEIGSVSGESFTAPVWIKFYPIGTYDPDGYIVLFEMDMDGDGTYDVIDSTLAGGSYEFTIPGNYTTTVRVSDDKGGVTTKSKSFTIIGSDYTYMEPQKEYQPVIETKPENVELDKKLDSIIEEYKQPNQISTTKNNNINKTSIETVVKEEKSEKSKQEFQKHESVSNISYTPGSEPLTTNRMYHPDSLVKRGSYATAVDISEDKTFNGKTTRNMEPGIDWTNGMFVHPGASGPTEIIYYHDGSDYILKGIVSVLDCVDYCASSGDCGFIIKGDDKELWHSSIVKQHDEPVRFNIFLKGINKLTLITDDGGDGITEDWSIWMDLEVLKQAEKENLKTSKNKNTKKDFNENNNVLTPSADTYVYAYSYNNWNEANFGQSEQFSVGWHSTGGEERGYLKFDLPNINVDDLKKAQLKIYIKETVGKHSLNMGVYNVLESWEEGSGTYHSGQPEPIDSSGAIIWEFQPAFDDSAFAQFRQRKKRDKSIIVDITALVKTWLANDSNCGLLLKPQGYLSGRLPTSIYKFYSREYEDKTKVPVLKLDLKK